MAIGDEEVLEPSRGRVRSVYSGRRFVGYQDPDLVIQRETAEGVRTIRNIFLPREVGVNRLLFDEPTGTLRDSFGTVTRVAHTKLPRTGSTIPLAAGAEVTYREVSRSTLNTTPRANQAYAERVVVRGVDGTIRTFTISGRQGQKFNPREEGKKWFAELRKSVGEDYSRGKSYKDLQQFVVTREYLRASWRTAG